MASNQTTNYKLNQWAAEDRVIREEFNDNFGTIDGALGTIPKIATGTYTGDGEETQFISTGFTPKAVYVCREDGCAYLNSASGYIYGGLVLADSPLQLKQKLSDRTLYYTAAEITEGGFSVVEQEIDSYQSVCCNSADEAYYYLAIG